jgi:pyruvate dehydrogenase E2 component (dihydrolipoamide acetyltransferase)
MTRKKLKLVAAGLVLAAGVAVAVAFFRQPETPSSAASPGPSDNVVLREKFDPRAEDEGATPHLSGRIEAAQAPAVATPPAAGPGASNAPPAATAPHVADRYRPLLAAEAGETADPFLGAAGATPGTPTRPSPRRAPYRRHVVRDGDTLAGLAERYLGRPDRRSEILALNREVLRSSEVLPIGAVLRIPPAEPAAAAPAPAPLVPTPAGPGEPPLVPVPEPTESTAAASDAPLPVQPTATGPPPADGWRASP